MTPKVAKGFADAIKSVTDQVVLSRLIRALERNDIQEALDVINLDRSAYRAFNVALSSTYEQSAIAITQATVWRDRDLKQFRFRWDMENPAATRYLQNVSSQLVTSMVEGQNAAIRTAITEGYSRGQGPRQIALDLVGRRQPNGRRQGGVVGLDGRQQATRARVARRLEMGEYSDLLRMTNRDKSLDAMLRRGQPLTEAQKQRYLKVHTNKALKTRGDRIARTETAQAVETARYDAFNEGLGRTGYPPEAVIKTWLHGGGGMNPRDQHIAMNRVQVNGLNTPFNMPDGSSMQYTHDPSGGANNIVNCTCDTRIRVDYGWGLE